jgi:hypothetical protein
LKRCHSLAAWLAIVALLIDGLLPTAVSAAVGGGAAVHPALCTAAGETLPGEQAPVLPTRHCALCNATAAAVFSSGHNELTARRLTGDAHPAIAPSHPVTAKHLAYASAQSRAPPIPTS